MRAAVVFGAVVALRGVAGHCEPQPLRADIRVRFVLGVGNDAVRLARDERAGGLYLLKTNGELSRVDGVEEGSVAARQILYTSAHHGLPNTQGLAVAADGTLYLTGFQTDGPRVTAMVVKGVSDGATGERVWSTVARTEPYELCDCWYNHAMNGIALSPDGRYAYVNVGSRSDHGEVQDNRGNFPGAREVGLTGIILRLPTDGQEIPLPNDREALRAAGQLYAEGVRNSFSLAFAPDGELFAVENGPNRDNPEELNWIRQGHHYGYPWRMGLEDNPQRFAGYDPTADPLLLASQINAGNGRYGEDPSFPPPPEGVTFTDPVVNLGPDADRFFDPDDGEVRDASDLGLTLSTFTAHRSPLGLVFDVDRALGPGFAGDGLVLSYSGPTSGLLNRTGDEGADLLHLRFSRRGDGYALAATRIARGFSGPVDAALAGDRLYVVEREGGRGLWEIALPPAATAVEERGAATPREFGLERTAPNPFNGATTVRYSTARQAAVVLTVHDVTGQTVRTLVDADLSPGRHEVRWDGRTDRDVAAASGVYLLRLRSGRETANGRLLLLR